MAHLLHIDSSIQGDQSVSRKLTARAVEAWKAANPGGSVTYRDLGSNPLPHLDSTTAHAGFVAPDDRTPAQAASWALVEEVVGEIKDADTIVLGLPLYNYGAPSSVKAWVDHLIAPGLSLDPETREPLLGGREFLVIATRGGGYGAGTPREGWDHAEQWLPHGVSMAGLEPEFIIAELTLAHVTPAMSELIPLAEKSLARAEEDIDARWARGPLAA
ncbi:MULTISPECIES: FMN-dependent NADH-azoreductase [Streptomyces]|uniref:FMN dependent NADH:quinone oxidoreductase n=1 Tax=Streptomyces cadmiisoli TaxID=2184053 RepID=A0A2Z4J8U9_9ACTN|nr:MULTISPECIES: NAD(P)H-dependent oxidoreductase [Streptomyces]AWW41357.1 FMN-dependent NADH-azoreductase [Streptomyces cadmiisoli]KOV52815.1 FMN-dependent NADH-azoreductase [Streptomyces sp. AS58]